MPEENKPLASTPADPDPWASNYFVSATVRLFTGKSCKPATELKFDGDLCEELAKKAHETKDTFALAIRDCQSHVHEGKDHRNALSYVRLEPRGCSNMAEKNACVDKPDGWLPAGALSFMYLAKEKCYSGRPKSLAALNGQSHNAQATVEYTAHIYSDSKCTVKNSDIDMTDRYCALIEERGEGDNIETVILCVTTGDSWRARLKYDGDYFSCYRAKWLKYYPDENKCLDDATAVIRGADTSYYRVDTSTLTCSYDVTTPAPTTPSPGGSAGSGGNPTPSPGGSGGDKKTGGGDASDQTTTVVVIIILVIVALVAVAVIGGLVAYFLGCFGSKDDQTSYRAAGPEDDWMAA